MRVELARAPLLYGEWLRRENRRVDAREHLRTAHEMLATMGVEAFADRAHRELLATGENVRKRTVETRDDLTAQEAQIARLARDGLSNPEIGVRLFISPRTVQYHLRKVFMKLNISSRSQLGGVCPPTRPPSRRCSRTCQPGRDEPRCQATTGHPTVAWRMRARRRANDTPRTNTGIASDDLADRRPGGVNTSKKGSTCPTN